MSHAVTQGSHHVGLTVAKLYESVDFFTRVLNWHEVGRDQDYPAVFVSDGHIMLTLWQAKSAQPQGFNRETQVGLHHLALQVANKDDLLSLHNALSNKGFPIEFAPQKVGKGPAMHMMCYEPSGIRLEFIWPDKS